MSRRIWVLTCALFGMAGPARADVIYDNLPTETYVSAAGSPVAGATYGGGYAFSHTETFIAGATDTLGDIKVAVVSAGGTPDFTLTLANSSGQILERWTTTAPVLTHIVNQTVSVVQVDSTLHPILQQGQTYKLTASPSSPTTGDVWESYNDSYTPGLHAGYRVEGTAVTAMPEPSGLAMMGAGLAPLAGFFGWVRRKARPTAA